MNEQEPVVVVGAGPVGIHCVKQIHKINPQQAVVLYGMEPHLPYNRIRLTEWLAGQGRRQLETELEGINTERVAVNLGCAIEDIDREHHIVTDDNGWQQAYSKLVLATGSRPHIPHIPGVDKAGIFTLRDRDTVQALMARQLKSRRTVVLGGGMLGLEAARAMQRHHTEVIVIDHATRLMSQQLDTGGSRLLTAMIYNLGIRLILGYPVQRFEGEDTVTGITLRNGKTIPCDTVILATGIQPNTELARKAGIAVARGIRIDDQSRTSDPDIYAAGECAEHKHTIYGHLAPGLEQAAVAAHNLLGQSASYKGSVEAARLNVVGKEVLSVGEVDEDELDPRFYHVVHYDRPNLNLYRKLVFRRNRLVGAIAVGEWHEAERIHEAILQRRLILPWRRRNFVLRGFLWEREDRDDVNRWPAGTVICPCKQIARAVISQAITKGSKSVSEVARRTGAGTVCGHCQGLIARMLG